MGRSSSAPSTAARARALAGVALAAAVFGFLADTSAAQQLSADDEVRLAAFRYLVGTLLPMDTTGNRLNCVEIQDDAPLETPPAGPGADPSPLLLARLVALGPHIVPRSQCELSAPIVSSSNPAVVVERPVVYEVGRPVRSAGGVRIPVAYYVHGMNGGGWICSAARSGRGWRIVDCSPTWIS